MTVMTASKGRVPGPPRFNSGIYPIVAIRRTGGGSARFAVSLDQTHGHGDAGPNRRAKNDGAQPVAEGYPLAGERQLPADTMVAGFVRRLGG